MITQPQSIQRITPATLVQRYPLLLFFGGAIGIDWLLALVIVYAPAYNLPIVLAMSYVPALAAWLVLHMTGTTGERLAFRQRLRTWRVGWRWYGVALLLIPAMHLAAMGVGALFFGGAFPFHWQRLPMLLAILPVNLGEEIAWRGFALPRLQKRFNGLTASLILGTLWAALHWVLWTVGIENPLPAILFATGWTISLTIIMTWLFNQTSGSVLLATLMHAATDTMFILVSPLAESNDILTAWALVTVMTALAALALVVITGVNLGQKVSVETIRQRTAVE
ncbi:MAG: CPBP family intramembrane glutamic endopeptidase [Caldilineaceae bacterium]